MTHEEIVDKVRSIMNELEDSASLLGEDLISLDTFIESAIPEAVAIIAKSTSQAVNLKTDGLQNKSENSYSAFFEIPSDYLSFVSLNLEDWDRTIFTILSSNTEEYNVQMNEYTRSGSKKPSCFLVTNYIGEVIEAFPISEEATLCYNKVYSSGITAEADSQVALAVCYMCASLVYNMFENTNTANAMQAMAASLL